MPRLAPLLGLLIAIGCADYDPPPDATLTQPETGLFELGDPLVITFTEPIEPSTVRIAVWPSAPEDKTVEGEFAPGVEPTLTCALSEGDCGDTTLTYSEDDLTLQVQLNGAEFAQAKLPWALELEAGLADLKGRATGVSYFFDFQFAPSSECGTEPIEFQDGIYLFWGTIQEPVPVTLQLYADVVVTELGAMRFAGGKGNNKEGVPDDTQNPDEITLDESNNGFALFAQGCVTNDEDVGRFFSTKEQDVEVKLLGGAVSVKISGLRITGPVGPHPTTGADRIEGTLSYGKLTLNTGGEPFDYPAGNTPFFMEQLQDAQIPDGVPRVCGDLCGKVPQGCDPPEDFAAAGFCDSP